MQTTRNLAVEELHKATKELFSGEQILDLLCVVLLFSFQSKQVQCCETQTGHLIRR